MEAADQSQALALKVKSKAKKFIIFFFFLFTITIIIDYDVGSLITYFIFFFIFWIFHKIFSRAFNKIPKKEEKKKRSISSLNSVVLFFFILILVFNLSVKLFTGVAEDFLNFIFLFTYIVLGFILVNIEMLIVYSCDRKLEIFNKYLLKRVDCPGNQINYFHLFGMYYLEEIMFFILFSIIYTVSLTSNNQFFKTIDNVMIFFCEITFFLVLFNFIKTRYPEIILFKHPGGKYIFIAIVAGICLFFLGGMMSDLNYYYIVQVIKIPSLLGEAGAYHDYYSYDVESVTAHLVRFFSLILIAPFVEELFFRGFLYNLIKKQYGITIGIIVSTAIFAFVHYNIYYRFIPMLLACIAMPYLYEKSKSLIPPIILHAIHNLLTIIF